MSGATYPARTVVDMARIPAEAWPRFVAELPAILACVAPLVAMYDQMREQGVAVPDSAYDDLVAKFDWIDDDKGTVNVSVVGRGDDGDVPFSTHHFNLHGDA